jgi:SnoaL-like domain
VSEHGSSDDRLDALERRVEELESLLDLYRFAATYGPAVDSNTLDVAAELWTEDGVYDIDVGVWAGREEVRGLFESRVHQDLVDAGCAHMVTMPRVSLSGNEAVVTCYQQLVHNDNGRFVIGRVSANRWELVRGEKGWMFKNRISRKLDGSAEARTALAHDL